MQKRSNYVTEKNRCLDAQGKQKWGREKGPLLSFK